MNSSCIFVLWCWTLLLIFGVEAREQLGAPSSDWQRLVEDGAEEPRRSISYLFPSFDAIGSNWKADEKRIYIKTPYTPPQDENESGKPSRDDGPTKISMDIIRDPVLNDLLHVFKALNLNPSKLTPQEERMIEQYYLHLRWRHENRGGPYGVYRRRIPKNLKDGGNPPIQDEDSDIVIYPDDPYDDIDASGGVAEQDYFPEDVDGTTRPVKRSSFQPWGGKRGPKFQPWGGKRFGAFQPWGGKRASKFQPWGGKRAPFQPWGGKRATFQPWGGKRATFQPWGGKRSSFQPWGGKRSSFQPWGGKRSEIELGSGLAGLRAPRFQPWGGKRSNSMADDYNSDFSGSLTSPNPAEAMLDKPSSSFQNDSSANKSEAKTTKEASQNVNGKN